MRANLGMIVGLGLILTGIVSIRAQAQMPVPRVGLQIQWSPVGDRNISVRAGVITRVIDAANMIVELTEFPQPQDHFGLVNMPVPAVQGPTLTDTFDTTHFDPLHPVYFLQMQKGRFVLTPAGTAVPPSPPAPDMPMGVPAKLEQWVTTAIPFCGNVHIGGCWTSFLW